MSNRVTYALHVEIDVDHAPEVSTYLLQVKHVLEEAHFGSEVRVDALGTLDEPRLPGRVRPYDPGPSEAETRRHFAEGGD